MQTNKRLLIVDDDKQIRELLTFDIEQSGYIVDSAADGEEGLKKAFSALPAQDLAPGGKTQGNGGHASHCLQDRVHLARLLSAVFAPMGKVLAVVEGNVVLATELANHGFSPFHHTVRREGPRLIRLLHIEGAAVKEFC